MFCYIYRSLKKENCYLYTQEQDEFSAIPEAVMTAFGRPHFVMRLPLKDERRYTVGTGAEIKQRLAQDGFFLQMLGEDDFGIASAAASTDHDAS